MDMWVKGYREDREFPPGGHGAAQRPAQYLGLISQQKTKKADFFLVYYKIIYCKCTYDLKWNHPYCTCNFFVWVASMCNNISAKERFEQ